jgi:hypothetical protein
MAKALDASKRLKRIAAEWQEIPGEEIVWHHVWALSDELTPSERQERLSWSGYPDLHF